MSYSGRTRLPGPVSSNNNPGSTARSGRGMRWKRLYLGEALASADPNSVIASVTETKEKTTVVLNDASSDTKLPSTGGLYRWDMSHLWNNWDSICSYSMCIVTVDEPGNTDNTWVVVGQAINAAGLGGSHQMYAGLHWDSGSGPDLRVASGTDPTPSDSGARTNLLHMYAHFTHGPDRRWDSVHAFGVDSSFDYDAVRHSTTGASPSAGTKALQPFVALGRSLQTPNNQSTIGFRADILIGPRNDGTWFPAGG